MVSAIWERIRIRLLGNRLKEQITDSFCRLRRSDWPLLSCQWFYSKSLNSPWGCLIPSKLPSNGQLVMIWGTGALPGASPEASWLGSGVSASLDIPPMRSAAGQWSALLFQAFNIHVINKGESSKKYRNQSLIDNNLVVCCHLSGGMREILFGSSFSCGLFSCIVWGSILKQKQQDIIYYAVVTSRFYTVAIGATQRCVDSKRRQPFKWLQLLILSRQIMNCVWIFPTAYLKLTYLSGQCIGYWQIRGRPERAKSWGLRRAE